MRNDTEGVPPTTADITTLRLDARDLDDVVTASLNNDSDETLAETIRRRCEVEHVHEQLASIPVPRWVVKPDARAAFQSAVHETASAHPTGPVPHIGDVLRAAWERTSDAAAGAQARLPEFHAEAEHAHVQLRDQQHRHVLEREGAEPAEPLRRQLRLWRIGEVALWGVEGLGLFAAVGDHLGIFSDVAPASAWVAALSITAIAVGTTMSLSFGCSWLWSRLSGHRLVLAIAGALIIGGAVVFAAGLATLRSTQGEDAFSDTGVTP